MDQVQRALGGCNDPSQQEADDSPSDRGSLLMEEVAVDWARHDVAPLPRKNGAAAAASSGTPAKKEIFTSVLVKRVFDVNTVEQTFGVKAAIGAFTPPPPADLAALAHCARGGVGARALLLGGCMCVLRGVWWGVTRSAPRPSPALDL